VDTAEMKARELKAWTAVTAGWRKHDARLVKAFGPVSERMLDKAGVGPGHRVLDIACGTGEPAIPAAERVGPKGHVLATDFVGEMIAFAREKAVAHGLTNIEFREVDGEMLDLPAGAFQAITMRWGLMFMPDPIRCLTRAHRALSSGGRIAVANWGPPDKNPWASVPIGCIRKYMDLPAPVPGQTGLFAFADPERIRATMKAAGFQEIDVEPFDVLWAGPVDGRAYFHEVMELAGPLAALYAKLPDGDKIKFEDDVARAAEAQSVVSPGVALRGLTWIASAVK
jgi:ubiquinone/menaquinone biosynthesis C-methylase UbiE